MANEVQSVTRQLSAELAPSGTTAGNVAEVTPEVRERWAKSRKAWAFIIGLATVAGGVAAVLALAIH
jgi:hypothetical protein